MAKRLEIGNSGQGNGFFEQFYRIQMPWIFSLRWRLVQLRWLHDNIRLQKPSQNETVVFTCHGIAAKVHFCEKSAFSIFSGSFVTYYINESLKNHCFWGDRTANFFLASRIGRKVAGSSSDFHFLRKMTHFSGILGNFGHLSLTATIWVVLICCGK